MLECGFSEKRGEVMIALLLGYPPSTNTYYRSLRKGAMAGRVIISEKGRDYRIRVQQTVGAVTPIDGKLSVEIILCPPDRRRRDVDNCLKALLDALTHAGVWNDDSQIKKLSVEMTDQIGGTAAIRIMRIE